MSDEVTLVIEQAVGEAAWDPTQQQQVEVNETLGVHPTRPGGRVGAVTLHELGVDPDGRAGFAVRAVRVDLPSQRPFGEQNTEFVFAQSQMDAHVGGYDAENGVWCGLNVEAEPLSFAVWVRAMLARRGFDVGSFGDFHVHARSKDVGSGYSSWVYQISLRGMAPTAMLWQTMWHYEPHPDGSLCQPLEIERVGTPSEPTVLVTDGDEQSDEGFDDEPSSQAISQLDAGLDEDSDGEYFTDEDFALWADDGDLDHVREWSVPELDDDGDAFEPDLDAPTLFDEVEGLDNDDDNDDNNERGE